MSGYDLLLLRDRYAEDRADLGNRRQSAPILPLISSLAAVFVKSYGWHSPAPLLPRFAPSPPYQLTSMGRG